MPLTRAQTNRLTEALSAPPPQDDATEEKYPEGRQSSASSQSNSPSRPIPSPIPSPLPAVPMPSPPPQPPPSPSSPSSSSSGRSRSASSSSSSTSATSASAAQTPPPVIAQAKPKFDLLALTDDSYNAWLQRLEDQLYSNAASDIYAKSKALPDGSEQTGQAPAIPDATRRAAWGAITATLPTHILLATDDVAKGDCEELLRRLRRLYYHPGTTTVSALLSQLNDLQLTSCDNVTIYVGTIRRLVDQLAQQGERPSDAMILYWAMRGLTSDYDVLKRELERLKPPPTLAALGTSITDYAAARPSITGGLSFKHSAHAATEACRNFSQTGHCRRGDRCRFQHIT